MRTRRLVLAARSLCIALALALPAAAGQAGAMDAGPVNQGLRLRLSVTTTVEGGVDVHTVRLDVLNVGERQVTLVADCAYEQYKGDYAEFVRSNVQFLSFPEVTLESAQTGGTVRRAPQPEAEIRPGGSLTVNWTTEGPRLNGGYYPNTTPWFPSNGLYGVRASWRVTVTEVGNWWCEGTVETLSHSGADTPLFPERWSQATLIPRKESR